VSRTWNFAAGPAAIPEPVLRQAQTELLEWRDARASVMEISHRGKAFMALAAETERDLRALADIPAHYRVLFLQGGATLQFALLAMNLAAPGQHADYVLSGHWSEKAAREAAPYVDVRIAADARSNGYSALPPRADWRLHDDAAYLHYTPNETIHGLEFRDVPEAGQVPLVADMSSSILSEPLPVQRFGMIYAGAQKNIGPAGLTLVIVREDLLARAQRPMAGILRYAEQAAHESMLNTPNTFGWYLAGLTFKWIAAQGGLPAMAARNRRKADTLYAAIDGSGGFYRNPVDAAARSRMNVPFFLHDARLDTVFLRESEQAGLLALKGHRALGGLRASLYNALPQEGVEALVAFMRAFQQRHG
jgi:phosphoserine aminotransferase